MRKLELKFGSIKEMLSKDQMKQISGGCCVETYSYSCGGGNVSINCPYSQDYCQGYYDYECEANDAAGNCCDGIDC